MSDALPAALVEKALEDVLRWPGLARSPQLAKFLSYIVRERLSGDEASFDTVILSPGAPSYGQLERPGVVFKNFEERGVAFVRLAGQLFGTAE